MTWSNRTSKFRFKQMFESCLNQPFSFYILFFLTTLKFYPICSPHLLQTPIPNPSTLLCHSWSMVAFLFQLRRSHQPHLPHIVAFNLHPTRNLMPIHLHTFIPYPLKYITLCTDHDHVLTSLFLCCSTQSNTLSTGSSEAPRGSSNTWLESLNSPLIQDSGDNKMLKLRFDVSQYAPEEIVVKTVDNKLLVSRSLLYSWTNCQVWAFVRYKEVIYLMIRQFGDLVMPETSKLGWRQYSCFLDC